MKGLLDFDRVKAIDKTYESLIKGVTAKGRWERFQAKLEHNLLRHYFVQLPDWRIRLRMLDPRERVGLLDFAMLGSVKSGTTAFTNYIIQHPGILFPLLKEPPDYSDIVSDPAATSRKNPFHVTVGEKAATERRHGKALTGFFNPRLMYLWQARIFADHNPAMKIVLILRNPVDRAYSQWKFDKINVMFRHKDHYLASVLPETFDEVIQIELDSLRRGGPGFPTITGPGVGVIQQGIYYFNVKEYFDRFGGDRVMVVKAEDAREEGLDVVREIYDFLELPEYTPRPIGRKAQLDTEALTGAKFPPISKETRDAVNDFVRPMNRKLYALIGRDMGWE